VQRWTGFRKTPTCRLPFGRVIPPAGARLEVRVIADIGELMSPYDRRLNVVNRIAHAATGLLER